MLDLFAIGTFGSTELLIILAIVVLLFGSKKLPELSRSVGESMRELKKAAKDVDETKQEFKTQVTEVKSNLVRDIESKA